MTVSLPYDKKCKIRKLCEEINSKETFKIRFLAHFIGVLVSSLPAIEHGSLYYRFLEANKNEALKNCCGNFEGYTSLNLDSKTEVFWWYENVSESVRLIKHYSTPDIIISMDASLTGWGAVYKDLKCGGHWSKDENQYHINVLELMAIFFGLKSLLIDVRGKKY